jgi:hypothetical protein
VAAAADSTEDFLAARYVSTTAGCIVVGGDNLLPITGYLGKQRFGPLANAIITVAQ